MAISVNYLRKMNYNPKTFINLIIDMKKLQTQVRQSVRKISLSLMFFITCAGIVLAQKNITGTVADKDKLPLAGVSVVVPGTTTGTVTDINGKFSLTIPSDAKSLLFSFVGMESKEVAIGSSSIYDVELSASMVGLDEVVVIGYGTQSREVLTTSISKLDTKVLANVPYANVTSALQGNIAGLRVQSISGQPGAAPRIILRGGTSISNPDGSTPLYIVDGIIRGIDDLNPDDIESIQVLKDAAATSIYGARASNGVIIVQTKSGKAGKTQFSYTYNLTRSEVGRLYDLASAKDFVYFMRLGIAASGERVPSVLNFLTQANAGGTGNDFTNQTGFTTMYLSDDNKHKLLEPPDQFGAIWETIPDPLDPSKTLIFKGTDFQKTVFRTGLSHNHSFSASGGTDKATFNVGVGYLTDEGIAINTDYKRLSVNLNGNLKVRDNVTVFARLLYSSYSNTQVPSVGTVFKNNINTAQTSKYMFEDGTLAPGRLFTNGNPAYYISRYNASNDYDRITLAFGTHWDILPGLSFDPQISWVKNGGYTRSFLKSYYNGPTTFNTTRASSGSRTSSTGTQADAVFTYVRKIYGIHNFDTKLGFSYYDSQSTSLSAGGRDAATDLIPTMNAAATPTSVSGSESETLFYGYFGRINYDFKQKYLVSLNARYDGASNLGASYKWGFFPGISVGWNIHKENFWTSVPETLSRLKLRGSYGVNGNVSGLGAYQAQGTYAVGSKYNGIAAIRNTVLANSELKWERSKTLDFGIDIGLLKDRMSILFDVYRRVTDNLLTNMSLPSTTGFSSILTNLGSLENKGFEMEFNASILPQATAFQWDLGFNASYVKVRILELPYNGIENNRIGGVYVYDPKIGDYAWKGGLQEGGAIGDMYAYKQLSIYATDEEAAAGPADMIPPGADKTKHGGDVNWLDVDGNNIIDETDRIYMGNPYPDWTGGFSNTFFYKGFSLVSRFDFTLGHMIYNETKARVLGNFSGQNAISHAVTRSWQKQGDITDIPRYYWADQNQSRNLWRGNSEYYEPGDFLCIREITLAYDFPRSLIQKLNISNLRLNITGSNLGYFTKFTGLNPEEGGTDNGRYPNPRNIIFGANITF